MKKIDVYIIKKFLTTFLFTIMLITVVSIAIDLSDGGLCSNNVLKVLDLELISASAKSNAIACGLQYVVDNEGISIETDFGFDGLSQIGWNDKGGTRVWVCEQRHAIAIHNGVD